MRILGETFNLVRILVGAVGLLLEGADVGGQVPADDSLFGEVDFGEVGRDNDVVVFGVLSQ